MIILTTKEVMSDADKYIHRVGVDLYYKRCTRLPEDRAEYFEEIEGLPPDEDIPEIDRLARSQHLKQMQRK